MKGNYIDMDIDINKYNELVEQNNNANKDIENFSNPWQKLSKYSPCIAAGFLLCIILSFFLENTIILTIISIKKFFEILYL